MVNQDRHVIEEMLREAEAEVDQEHEAQQKQATRHRLRRVSNWFKDHTRVLVLCLIIAAIAGLAAVPMTRYKLAGLVIRRDITLHVVDTQTGQPVSGAEVTAQGVVAKTDTTGTATFHRIKPGKATITVAKKYYQTASQTITVGLRTTQVSPIAFMATGRQIPVRITNKITGASLANVTITAASTETQANDQGEAIIVVDAGAATVPATLSVDGYNTTNVNITVSQQVTANSFTMTPAGNVYFLSKQSGTIDVVKTDLDGSNRKVVLAGTGNEETNHTTLLASHDWKFLVLLARRDGNRAVLHLIDTSDNKRTEIDSNNATFQPIGWSGHNFVYSSRSNIVADWQPGQTQLKVFNADTGTLTVIDQTQASGTSYMDYIAEQFSAAYLLDDTILYAKNWQGTRSTLAQKKPGIYTSALDKPDVKLLKSFAPSLLNVAQASPEKLYIQHVKADGSSEMFTCTDGTIQPETGKDQALFGAYHPTYIPSPDGNSVLWYEPHGDQYSLYIGSVSDDQSRRDVLDTSQQYTPYGWYSQDYVVLSSRNQLYIAPASGEIQTETLQKIADYHAAPAGLSSNGYGGV